MVVPEISHGGRREQSANVRPQKRGKKLTESGCSIDSQETSTRAGSCEISHSESSTLSKRESTDAGEVKSRPNALVTQMTSGENASGEESVSGRGNEDITQESVTQVQVTPIEGDSARAKASNSDNEYYAAVAFPQSLHLCVHLTSDSLS